MATPRNARPGMLLDPGAPINKGLVGWWPMWEGAGGKTLDISGKDRHGTLTNGPLWSGGGVKFDGADDLIVAAGLTELQGSSTFTIMLEAAQTAFSSADAALAIRDGTTTSVWIIYPYEVANGNGPYIYYNGSAVIDINTGSPVADGRFNTFLFKSNSATSHEFFINGVLAQSNTTSRTMSATLSDTTIGTWYSGAGQNLNGWVRNVRVWSRPLSTPEIQALAVNPNFGLWVPDIRRYYIPAAGSTIAKAVTWRVMSRASKSSAWRIFGRSLKASAWSIFTQASKSSAWRIFGRSLKASAWRIFTQASKAAAWRVFTRASKASTWGVFTRAAKVTTWSILNTLQASRAVAWRIIGRASKPSSWRILTRVAKSSAWRIFTRASKASAWSIFNLLQAAKAVSWRVIGRTSKSASWRILTRTSKVSAWRLFTRAMKPASWHVLGRKAVISTWRVLTRLARASTWRIGNLPTAEPDVHLNATAHKRHMNAGSHVRTIFAKLPKQYRRK